VVNRWIVAWKALCGKFEVEPIQLKNPEKNVDYQIYELEFSSLFDKVGLNSNRCTSNLLKEAELFQLRRKGNSVLPTDLDGSKELARVCYISVRLLKPLVVVETGVSRGVTSAFILKALDVNGKGTLYSIELPHLSRVLENDIGSYVPNYLRHRWKLILGSGQKEIQKLRKKINIIDMFVHDSDHSYANQLLEYRLAWAWLSQGGLIISDDVQTSAFMDFCNENSEDPVVLKQDKDTGFIGMIRKSAF
jgi:predicted O-methyltransferase YrrM